MQRTFALIALASTASAMPGMDISICFKGQNTYPFGSEEHRQYKYEMHNEATRQCRNTPPCKNDDLFDNGRRVLSNGETMECHMRCDGHDEGTGIETNFPCSEYGMACVHDVKCHVPPAAPGGLRIP
uniref:Uncharacterized protein n=1 Tax=Odontella aurita TaxID=265563 RepID=A0A7S4IZV2_9STRA|mmetsp:Transcript_34381/g.102898  ORF Transcript_34381/g.102898 Transcript_34381/m.102898 type:complete len:127 (+) Transcript_34381:190-570(+)